MKGGISMRRAIGALVLGSVLVAGAGKSAAAQSRGFVQLGGGVSIPMGDFADGVDMGFLGQVAAGISKGLIGGRVNATLAQHGFKGGGDGNFRIFGAMGDLVVSPNMSGKIGVYVLGGAGIQNGKETGHTGDSKFAWNVGGGLKLKAGSLGVFVEGRFLSVQTENVKTNMIPITAGVRLGGN